MLENLIYADNYALQSIREAFYSDADWFRWFVLIIADVQWIATAILLVALWLYGVKKKDNTYKIQSLNTFYVIVGGFALYVILNQFLPTRVRPEVVSSLPPLVNHLPDNSFPSGHAIFAAASFLGVHYCIKNRALTLAMLLLGIIMNFARIVSGVHFPGDIVVGYIVGLL